MELEVVDYKKEIEDHAVEYFKDLHIGMPPSMIAQTISWFEFSLSKMGLVDQDFDICHSPLFYAPKNWTIEIRSLSKGIARIYGTKAIKLFDDKGFSFSFVGYLGDVHACYVSLKKLFDFAKEVKKEYSKQLKSKSMKASERKEELEDFADNWIEDITAHLHPTAITGDDFSEFDQYISEHFVSEETQNECDTQLANFLKILADSDGKNTCKTVSDTYLEKHGKSLSDLLEMRKKIEGKPVVLDH